MEQVVNAEFVKDLIVNKKWTHRQISEELKKKYPAVKGLSEMSVRRFCTKYNIHRTSRLSDGELDVIIKKAVSEVGPTYGRKLMKGKLESEHIRVHDKRITSSLKRVSPKYHQHRIQNTARLMNPVPYNADYFGHKLHLDQNEKLVMYGCTSILAVDGYSRHIMAIASMPIKNNIEIYKSVYRPIVLKYGLWDQLRVDCGKEFYLTLYIQQSLSPLRYNTLRSPVMQTPSTKNHMAERHWVEMNSRINYPIKAYLNQMVEDEIIDMRDDIDKFCVSWITIRVVQAGVQELLPAWNHHHIPGIGRPVDLMVKENKAVSVPETAIPNPEIAHEQYERSGGKLKTFGNFGEDPLAENPQLQNSRSQEFSRQCPSFSSVFNAVVNNDPVPFRNCIETFINITKTLSQIVL